MDRSQTRHGGSESRSCGCCIETLSLPVENNRLGTVVSPAFAVLEEQAAAPSLFDGDGHANIEGDRVRAAIDRHNRPLRVVVHVSTATHRTLAIGG